MVHRLERTLWYLFLFIIPWQTRVIFWQLDPVFSEWRSIALWGTDVVIVLLLAFAWWNGWRFVRPDRTDRMLIPLVAAAAVSLVGAEAPEIGLYHLARLTFFATFFLYVRHWALHRFPADTSVLAFVLGALVQAGIGWGQALAQHDLGLRVMGETMLTPFMRGVAVFFDGPLHKVLRSYGTLPHPNLLAIVLALALWGLVWLWLRHGTTRTSRAWRRQAPWVIAGALLLWAFGLTYARTVAVAWALGSVAVTVIAFSSPASGWRNITLLRNRLFAALVLVAVVGGLFLAVHFPQVLARMSIHGGDEAIRLRLDFARDALASGGEGSWLSRINWVGVGFGTFTSWLAAYDPSLPDYLLQPAHSIYLMAYAETGVIGTIAFIAFLASVVGASWHAYRDQPLLRVGILIVVAAVLLVGTWDHFFWTLQQGRIMFWLVLAVAAGIERGRTERVRHDSTDR